MLSRNTGPRRCVWENARMARSTTRTILACRSGGRGDRHDLLGFADGVLD
jgi:hypothetical protein